MTSLFRSFLFYLPFRNGLWSYSIFVSVTVQLEQKRPKWRITYLLYYLFDLKHIYIYKLTIISSIAHKTLVVMVTTFENISLATAKLAIL